MNKIEDYALYPDQRGRFGDYGGAFVAETLVAPLAELTAAFETLRVDPAFIAELDRDLKFYVGRPSPIYHAERLSKRNGGAQILLKREDLNHTGAHKINNTVGQALVARHMGKRRIIAETGAGQHGVATATVCARLGLDCVVYMGEVDIERQKINVYRMTLLGAEVVPVTSGSKTLKDALNEAMRDWVTNVADTFYIIGTVAGPHPYPQMVRDFNAVVGREARVQMQEQFGRLPDALVACVGGGSNAIGLFHAFLNDAGVAMYGAEAAGDGIDSGRHAASLAAGRPGILHGNRTYVLCDDDGQITETHSVSAGLDYPGVGPEHAFLKDAGRAQYLGVSDDEALAAFHELARSEGILAALESSHAVALVLKLAREMPSDAMILCNLSGRGDKDVHTIAAREGIRSVSRLETRFTDLAGAERTALVPFFMAGDPLPDATVNIMHALVAAGADAIELGVPFSDPMADGPVIQHASERALKRGVGLAHVIEWVREFRHDDGLTPVVLMGYLNPIAIYGIDKFAIDAAAAGVDGVLLVDCPIEESAVAQPLRDAGIDQIFLVAPTTTDERLARVCEIATGFIYYVSFAGITGADRLSLDDVRARVGTIKQATMAPVAVGFGVRDADTASAIGRFADAVVIGSALVERLAGAVDEMDACTRARDFLGPIRAALDLRAGNDG